jgi:SAM-dependent methyltransferase
MELTPPVLEDLVEEYEHLYRVNPLRWDEPLTDDYALNILQNYLRIATNGAPTSMLDIGCGSGHTIERFSSSWPETKMYGIDLSTTAIEIAQKRVPSACFSVGSLESATFREKFQVVTAIGVLEHFVQPADAFSRIRDLLSPGGILYVLVPNCISYRSSRRVEGLRRLNTGSQQWEWHLYRDTWEGWIRSAGFSIGLSLKGPRLSMEFIWILTQGEKSIPVESIPFLVEIGERLPLGFALLPVKRFLGPLRCRGLVARKMTPLFALQSIFWHRSIS